MRITIDVPDAEIRGALKTANKAIHAWAPGLHTRHELATWTPRHKAWVYCRKPNDGLSPQPAAYTLDIERGLQLMIADGRWPIASWNHTQADVFVQYAAFGKVVYR